MKTRVLTVAAVGVTVTALMAGCPAETTSSGSAGTVVDTRTTRGPGGVQHAIQVKPYGGADRIWINVSERQAGNCRLGVEFPTCGNK